MQIKSQVLSDEMETLPGANVLEVGSTNSTSTDGDGRFSINVISANAQLQISYVGFETKTFRAGDINNSFVELPTSTEMLDSVTVYSNGKKSDNTLWLVLGAIAATIAGVKIFGGKPTPRTVKP